MGYDISAKFKNQAQRDEMMDFWAAEADLLAQLLRTDYAEDVVPSRGENLGVYAPQNQLPKLIGFHGTGISWSQWAVCAWMAVKAGTHTKGRHYFYYDSDKMYVSVNGQNDRDFETDANGVAQLKKERHPEAEKLSALLHPNKDKTIKILLEIDAKYKDFKAGLKNANYKELKTLKIVKKTKIK